MNMKKYLSLIGGEKKDTQKLCAEKDFTIQKLTLEKQGVVDEKNQVQAECENLKQLLIQKENQNKALMRILSKYYNLYDTIAIINSIYDFQALLKYINEAVLNILEVEYCSILLFDVKGRLLLVEKTNIYDEEELNTLTRNSNDEAFMEVIEGGGIYVSNNININEISFINNSEIKSFCLLPITTISKKYGVILIESKKKEKFDKEIRKLATSIGYMFAQSLENILLYKKISEIATLDGLTGIYNRRYFQDRLTKELNLAKDANYPLALMIFDIDHFKRVNDTYSHQVGDRVLKEVVNSVREILKKAYILARYGGEEFVVIMPNQYIEEAAQFAERCRQAVEAREIPDRGKILKVTASFGVACFPDNAQSESNLIKVADRALYKAKETGRNKIEISDEKI